MAKDLFHNIVKNALIKDNWTITDDPLSIDIGEVSDLQIDLGAERLIAATKEEHKIAVEIKSFIGSSPIYDLHLAIG